MTRGTPYIEGYPVKAAPTGVELLLATDTANGNATVNIEPRTLLPAMRGEQYALAYASGVAINDGQSHPLSGLFGTLAAAQAAYPHAVALTDELGGVAIQAAINASRIANGVDNWHAGGVVVPPGDVRVNRPISTAATRGLHLTGTGLATRLFWYGDNLGPLIDMPDTRDAMIGPFQIVSAVDCAVAIRAVNDPTTGVTPTHNTFWHIYFEGATHWDYCVQIGNGNDNNNEFHQFEGCQLGTYKEAGLVISGLQAYAIQLRHTTLSGGGVGKYGVYCVLGGFRVEGGGGGANTVADFRIDTANAQPFLIDGWSSEESARLLYIPNYTTAPKIITFQNVRWASGAEAAGNDIIYTEAALNLTIRDSVIAYTNAQNRAGGQKALTMTITGAFQATAATSRFVLEDVRFGTSLNGNNGPFPGQRPTSLRDVNIITTDPNTSTPLLLIPHTPNGATPSLYTGGGGGDQLIRINNNTTTTVTDFTNYVPNRLYVLVGDGVSSLTGSKFVLKAGKTLPYLLATGETIALIYDLATLKWREV